MSALARSSGCLLGSSTFHTCCRSQRIRQFAPYLAQFRTSTFVRRPSLVIHASARQERKPLVEVVRDSVADNSSLESPKLDVDVRRRAEESISRRGGRVTVGDVAADSGLSVFQTEEALKALAADSLATLQVSSDGEIVYVFERGFKDIIRGKSLRLRLEPVIAGIAEGAAYLARITFGTALVTSVVVVSLAFVAIASSRDDRNGGGRGSYSYRSGPHMWFNLTDVLWYWDPYYYRRRSELRASGDKNQGMGFLEAVFSFVFGDGNPNAGYNHRRWVAVGRYIQSRGGVVTAEELAPFLDVTPDQISQIKRRGGVVTDESYVMPALIRFNGNPEVDGNGNILYTFPSLQQTGRAARTAPPTRNALESRWELTEASAGQKLGVVALGVANFFGVFSLSAALANPANVVALARGGMGWVFGAMPLLQAYAASFFIIPAIRWALNAAKNSDIDARNAARQEALHALQMPSPQLQVKIGSAERQAQRNVISERNILYRSDRSVENQPIDLEADNWERRLQRRTSLDFAGEDDTGGGQSPMTRRNDRGGS